MITRPLNLASQLRPEPRNFDFLFLVNAGLLALFFTVFGSRFVLAPGLAVDFQVPQLAGARAGAVTTTDQIVISAKRAGVIIVDEGPLNMAQLHDWLKKKGKKTRQPSLLVLAGADVPVADLTYITSAAQEAGFVKVVLGAEDPTASPGGSRR